MSKPYLLISPMPWRLFQIRGGDGTPMLVAADQTVMASLHITGSNGTPVERTNCKLIQLAPELLGLAQDLAQLVILLHRGGTLGETAPPSMVRFGELLQELMVEQLAGTAGSQA